MIALPHLSDLALGELAYSRCASWEHGNMGALGQEGGVGCAKRLQRKFGRGHDGEPDEVVAGSLWHVDQDCNELNCDTRHNGRLLYLLYETKRFA